MDVQLAPAAAAPDPVSVEQVLATIQAALSVDTPTRTTAESLLKSWEADAAPGFLSSLLRIVEQAGVVDEATRLLAVVIAKNAVGSSWRKTLGTREWSRVPEEEKAMVRQAAMHLLLRDSSERVATQLGLLITNIARFDFPIRAEDLLAQLIGAAQWESQVPLAGKLRALKALRYVLSGLVTKRFVIEPSKGPQVVDLKQLSAAITAERLLFHAKIREAMEPVRLLFLQHSDAFLQLAPGWDAHARFAKAAIKAVAELLALAQAGDDMHPGTAALLEQVHKVCSAVTAGPPQGLDASQQAAWLELGGRLYERMTRCVIAYLDAFPVQFAEYVPYFLTLYVENALIKLDAATVRAMRPQRRVLLVRFIAKALLCPFYHPEWVAAPMPTGASPEQRQLILDRQSRAGLAHAALNRLLAPEQGGLLVEAVVTKYVALAPEEIEEWQADPEGYVRSMDVESGPDADTPRPIGVGLLLCMLERGGESIAQSLISLAARLQAGTTPDAVLAREACYRCIGEGYTHVAPHINFQAWFESELCPQLSTRLPGLLSGQYDLISAVLQARSLWLLGVCGQDLPHAQWCMAYKLVVQHMAAQDLVVSLTAVSSAMALTALIMDDQAMLEQYQAATKPRAGIPSMMEAMSLQESVEAARQQESSGLIGQAQQRVSERQAGLADVMPEALTGCFTLLGRLAEVESMVRVLQLVSVLVEVMGERIRPQLGLIAGALPQIWATASAHVEGAKAQAAAAAGGLAASASSKGRDVEKSETGAVVRLHSALMAVLTHLVAKLRSAAMNDPQLQSVVYPMLQYSTNLGSPESECLVEEAFRLWNAALSSLPHVPQPTLALLPNLGALLTRGRDNVAVFPLLEAYLLLDAAASLQPLSAAMAQALLATTNAVATEALSSVQKPASASPAVGGPAAAAAAAPTAVFRPETAQEAMAVAALTDVLLQLFPQEAPSLLLPTLKAMSAMIAHPALPASGINVKILNVMEAFLEVLGRLCIVSPSSLGELLGGDVATLDRFLDKWLVVASARFLEEIIGVKTMAMLGRFRRRMASAALCSMVRADTLPPAYDEMKMCRIISLLIQCVADNLAYHQDQLELEALDFKSDLQEDYVLSKRLAMSRSDVLRRLDVADMVRQTLVHMAGRLGGEEALAAAMERHSSPSMQAQMRLVLEGKGAALSADGVPLVEGEDDEDLMLQGLESGRGEGDDASLDAVVSDSPSDRA